MADDASPRSTLTWTQRADQAAADIAPLAARHDRDQTFVAEAYGLLKARGFFKAHVPVEFGGGGADYAEVCEIVRRLSKACGSTGLAFAMHCHLVALAAWRHRHQGAPTEGLLRRVADENLILVSSGGSDWLASGGTAAKVDGGFRITARKVFSSGSPAGDLLMTSAVYEDPDAGPTVLHFAVPFKAEGVRILDTWRVMGMRGTGSNDVELDGAFVADAAISGRRPRGPWHPLFHAISMIAFPIIYAAYLGVAEGARDVALQAARKKPADDILVNLTGEMENAYASADLALRSMIDIALTEQPGPEVTSRIMVRRTLAGQGAIRTVERAFELAGGQAFYTDLGLERAFRDIQGARFHPLQEKQQLRYTGRLTLGLDIDA